jgi:hypothetical protein
MRRLIATLLVLPALAFPGCGGDESGSPLDTALSYLPRDAVFAAALDTDVDGDQYRALNSLLDEFAFAGQVREQLQEQLRQASGGRFDEDVRPLLGNPAVVGVTQAPEEEVEPVLAMQTADEEKLNQLVERRDARELGEAAGATLYQEGETFFAVEGDVIVFASDRRRLTAAVERADGDDHLDEEAFDSALEGLPEDAVARMYADVEALLRNDPDSADARRVKWIAALRTLGAAVVAKRESLEVDFRLRTEGDLSDADLPIAPGDESPGVIDREGEVGVGVRDLAHIVRFAENAAQAIDPAGFGDYAQAKRTIDQQLGVSLDDDLVGQLGGDVAASVSPLGGFGVRAELDDPEAFTRTLARVADVLPSFARGAGFGARIELTKPGAGDDFYELSERDGGSVFFGVAGDALVVASDRARAEELATTEPSAVDGAAGSVVTSTDAEQLANELIAVFGEALGIPDLGGLGTALITGPLGELNGHVSASPDELRGSFELAIE